jgi:hypothetical protein
VRERIARAKYVEEEKLDEEYDDIMAEIDTQIVSAKEPAGTAGREGR